MNKRWLFFLSIIGAGTAFTLIVFLLFNLQKEPTMYPVNRQTLQLPLMEIEKVKLMEWDEQGEKLWILKADKATQFSQRIISENVKLELFQKGEPASRGEAKQVVMEIPTSNLWLKGDIHITSYQEIAELETSELRWDSSEKKLHTEKEVTIKKGMLVIQGKGLICKPDLSSVIIKEQVTTYYEGGI
ncbi:LPS export ABC transporter periplasmic protein LptC [Candidatus Aerophobetes bacterium]|nr:LPS export ABC transporter periplasmic protein LptC [Candidatus Aerophobetes bacterium]